jgi:hypothetical protein
MRDEARVPRRPVLFFERHEHAGHESRWEPRTVQARERGERMDRGSGRCARLRE